MALSEAEELELLELENENAQAQSSTKPIEQKAPGTFGSALLGVSQGASAGFGEEGAAAIAGAGKDIMAGKLPTLESYRNARQSIREKLGVAIKEHPWAYGTGEFAGAIGTGLMPGMQATTLPRLAAYGALQGLGNSTADLTQGNLSGAATDTAIGGATGVALGKFAPPVIRGGIKLAKFVGKQLFSSILGPSVEAISAYLKNPAAIKTASMEGLAEAMPEVATKFGTLIKTLSNKAKSALSSSADENEGALLKDEILSAIDKARARLGNVFTDESLAAAKTLDRITNRVSPKNTMSQMETRNLILDLDSEIPWDRAISDPRSLTATDKALINTREALNNTLKTKNEAYAEALKPVEEAIGAQNDFLRKFSIQRIKHEGFKPSDTTYSRVNTALKEGKLDTDRVIANVKRITGVDITPQVQNAKYAQEFTGGRAQGSRNVNTMAVLGSGLGFGVGSALGFPTLAKGLGIMGGAAAGSIIDRKGGDIAAAVLDKYIAGKQATDKVGAVLAQTLPDIITKAPQVLGKYAPILKRAAAFGTQQLMLQHWILADEDPDYKKLIGQVAGAQP